MKNNGVPPKVGDRLFGLAINNEARRKEPGYHKWFIVQKVGKKYFYAIQENLFTTNYDICDYNTIKFDIGSWYHVTEYSANWECYPTEQEYRDKAELDALYKKMSESFRYHNPGLNIEQLRTIDRMLDEIKPKAKS